MALFFNFNTVSMSGACEPTMTEMSTLVAVAEFSATTGSSVAKPPRANPITICVPVSKQKDLLYWDFSVVKFNFFQQKSPLLKVWDACKKALRFSGGSNPGDGCLGFLERARRRTGCSSQAKATGCGVLKREKNPGANSTGEFD